MTTLNRFATAVLLACSFLILSNLQPAYAKGNAKQHQSRARKHQHKYLGMAKKNAKSKRKGKAKGKARKKRSRQYSYANPGRHRQKQSGSVRAHRKSAGGNLSTSVNGIVGILTGVSGIDETIFAFGGDASYPVTGNVTVDGGLLYWGISHNVGFVSINVSVLTVDAGPIYHVPLSRSTSFCFGGRFGLARVSVETQGDLLGYDMSASASESTFLGTAVGGIRYASGSLTMGAELRKILFTEDALSDFDGIYALGVLGVNL